MYKYVSAVARDIVNNDFVIRHEPFEAELHRRVAEVFPELKQADVTQFFMWYGKIKIEEIDEAQQYMEEINKRHEDDIKHWRCPRFIEKMFAGVPNDELRKKIKEKNQAFEKMGLVLYDITPLEFYKMQAFCKKYSEQILLWNKQLEN